MKNCARGNISRDNRVISNLSPRDPSLLLDPNECIFVPFPPAISAVAPSQHPPAIPMRLPRPEALLGPAEWEDIAVTQWCLVPGILPHWECHRSSWQGAGSQCLQEIQMTWTTSSAPQIFTAEGKCSQEAPAEVTLHRRPAFVSRNKRDTSKQCLNQIHTQHRSWHLQVALQLGHLIRHWGNTMILGTTTKVFNQAYPAPALYQVLSYVLGKNMHEADMMLAALGAIF